MEKETPYLERLDDHIGKAEEQNSLRTIKRVRTTWTYQMFSGPGQLRKVRLIEDGRGQEDQGEDEERAERAPT